MPSDAVERHLAAIRAFTAALTDPLVPHPNRAPSSALGAESMPDASEPIAPNQNRSLTNLVVQHWESHGPYPLRLEPGSAGLIHLRVKIRSLADEARVIRSEEARAKRARRAGLLSSLRNHRVQDVRLAARHAQLAYGFLRGRPYHDLEPMARTRPDLRRLIALVERFGNRAQVEGDLMPPVWAYRKDWIDNHLRDWLGISDG